MCGRWALLLALAQIDRREDRGIGVGFLDGLAKPGRLEGPDPSLLVAAYSAIARDARPAGGTVLL